MDARIWFGRYQYMKRMGSSERGDTFLVRDMRTGQLRVLKFIPKAYAACAETEIQILRQLRYPALPWLYHVKKDQYGYYLVIGCLKGRTLWKYRSQRDGMKVAEIVSIGCRLCEAAAYLHGKKPRRILHLDIQPENILLDEDGQVSLVDFGNAMFAGQGRPEGVRFGTLGFAAPEQYAPGGMPDERTDLFSIGRVLLFLLTGKTVHEEPELLEKEIRRWRSVAYREERAAEEELLLLIEDSTRYRAEERIQTAEMFRNHLSELRQIFRL